jgi:hypothetical protein
MCRSSCCPLTPVSGVRNDKRKGTLFFLVADLSSKRSGVRTGFIRLLGYVSPNCGRTLAYTSRSIFSCGVPVSFLPGIV